MYNLIILELASTTKSGSTTEREVNNRIRTRTAQHTDRPADMNAGDDIMREISENQTDK
jgi:hypothetical protein